MFAWSHSNSTTTLQHFLFLKAALAALPAKMITDLSHGFAGLTGLEPEEFCSCPAEFDDLSEHVHK